MVFCARHYTPQWMLNSKFIIDMLNNLDCEDVVLEMSAPNRAGIMVPAVQGSEYEDVLMLVMPVMLNG